MEIKGNFFFISRAPQAIAEERHFKMYWPSGPQRLYSLTLASNYATRVDAYKAYEYVIRRMPGGHFTYVRDLSKRGKYHIHGIMKFDYNFSFQNLMDSRNVYNRYDQRFDIHIKYDELDLDHFQNFAHYMYTKGTVIRTNEQLRGGSSFQEVPECCIPIVEVKTVYRSINIPL